MTEMRWKIVSDWTPGYAGPDKVLQYRHMIEKADYSDSEGRIIKEWSDWQDVPLSGDSE